MCSSRHPEFDFPSNADRYDSDRCLYVNSHWNLMQHALLTIFLVGFYAGLNLIAWGMIFCFVRETKQLTLEEIDRK
jgi:hypothetical protein